MYFSKNFLFKLLRFILFMAVAVSVISFVLFTYVPKDEFYKAVDYSSRNFFSSADTDIVLIYPSLLSEQKPLKFNVSDTEDAYQMIYYWNFDGYSQSYRASVPKEMYEYYRGRPHDHDNYHEYALSDYDREVVRNFANAFREHGIRYNYTDEQIAFNIISFVSTLPYTYDSDTTGFDDYPRYPVETLVEGGDCEDRAILIAALLYELGQKTILIRLETHVSIGLEDNGNYTGQYYDVNGTRYYYADTGENGVEVGILPSSGHSRLVQIHPVSKVPSILPSIRHYYAGVNSSEGPRYNLYGTIDNRGPGEVKNASIRVVISESGAFFNSADIPNIIVPIGDLPEDSKTEIEFVFPVPRINGNVQFYIEGDNIEPTGVGGFYFNLKR